MNHVATPNRKLCHQWIESFITCELSNRPALIDIRPSSEYVRGHVHGSTHFDTLSTAKYGLKHRTNELPPPQNRRNMAVIASCTRQLTEALKFLSSRGYANVTPILFEHLPSSICSEKEYISTPLWHPAPLLTEVLPLILPHINGRTAVDIGAGSGRDATYLSYHGFNVTAVDRDENLLGKATRLASFTPYHRHFALNNCKHSFSIGSVKGITRTFGANLSSDALFLRENAAHLLLVVRFLRQGVLQQLHHAVLPGGLVIYEHFCLGCEKFPCGPRKISQILQPDDLVQAFSPSHGFSVWMDERSTLSDGRPIIRFVARRNLSSA